jgi:hydroxymethylbilane synthase
MLIIGSRGSKLALWQAEHVQSLLATKGVETKIEIIRTVGDRIQDVPISTLGTKGVFTKEIEDALLAGEIDLAVHSLKDMMTTLPEGLVLAATPEREDPHDALAGRPLNELPEGAAVGTSSTRRAAQLRVLRPDLQIREIRGNVDTRLRKLDEGQYDAVVLAGAGLRRLGLAARIVQEFTADEMTPAPGQGALAIETRPTGAGYDAALLLNDSQVYTAVTAERAVLEALGGGCQVPIGAYAEITGTSIRMRAMIARDGEIFRQSGEGHAGSAREFGLSLGALLLGALLK